MGRWSSVGGGPWWGAGWEVVLGRSGPCGPWWGAGRVVVFSRKWS